MEQSEYPVTQLWSDIGGAAGLMLGISFSTAKGQYSLKLVRFILSLQIVTYTEIVTPFLVSQKCDYFEVLQ